MEEPSLLDLLQGLEEVQAQKTEVRLSERNVVELVNKLKSMGLVGDDLLHTTNGREYVTREALARETAAVLANAHRTPLVDLPAALGVDLVHCKEAARKVVAGDHGQGILLAQEELFAPAYFDTLAGEVDELLQEQGMASIGDLAQRFGLGSELLMSQLTLHLGQDVDARLDGGYLYTTALTSRLKAQLRGALRGATVPVSIPALLAALGLGGTAFTQSLVPGLVDQLLAEGAVHGSLAGGATSWIPAAFVVSQAEQARQFYTQNGYIEWSMARKLVPQDSRQWLAREAGGALVLKDAYISPTVLHQLEAAVEDVLADAGWVDARQVLPAGLSGEDAAELVHRATSGNPGVSVPTGCYVMSESLLSTLRGAAEAAGKQAATEPMPAALAAPAAAAAAGARPAQAAGEARGGSAGAKGKGGGKGGDSSDEDWGSSASKRKGGRKGGGKGGAGKKGASDRASAPRNSGEGGAKTAPPAEPPALSEAALAAAAAASRPDLEGEAALLGALGPVLRRAALAALAEARHAQRASGAERRRALRDAADAALQSAYERLGLHAAHGAAVLSSAADPAARDAAERHLLRTLGLESVNAALRGLGLETMPEEAVAAAAAELEASGGVLAPLAPAERGRLAAAGGPAALAAVEAATQGLSVQELLDALGDLAKKEGLRLKLPDKRRERELLAAHKADLAARLADCQPGDGPATLAIAVPLLLARRMSRAVNFPGRALASGLAALEGALDPETAGLLNALHSAVLARLHGAEGGEGLEELATRVRTSLLAEDAAV